MAKPTLLIADIGGTNARFALADAKAPGFSREQTLQCADFPSVEGAIQHYLKQVRAAAPSVICLAAAGPVVDQHISVTNNHWALAVDDLSDAFSTDAVRLMNDFEAIAYSIPALSGDDCLAVGLPDPEPLPEGDFTVAIVGPGTGLGSVGLRRYNDALIPIASEASHGGFAPETRVQLDVLVALREQFDRVSSERVVSGSGLENIFWALGQIHGDKLPKLSAPQIFAAAGKSDEHAAEAVALFFEVLGQFAGDFALAISANDGVYIGGGIVRRYPEMFANSRFRSGFEGKGRHRSILERIPTQLIMHPQPGLLGASCVAQAMAADL
ncbi:MAG: glucokinase [Woeseiaceae bacterium]|nr:glucokinase [Woeseiaceae bacterium]NIP19523.1 glucokinase [Woeseiaceae bacterium]NIS88478.1 glucokinase [Woeseiaceae bacterium]